MASAAESKRYLVVLQIPQDVDQDQLKSIMVDANNVLKRASDDGKFEVALKTSDAEVVGFLLRSKLVPQQIIARLEAPDPAGKRGASFTNTTRALVLEIGGAFAERGFGRINGWLMNG